MIDDNKPDDGLHGSSFNDDPLADIHDHRPAQLTDKKILPQGVVSKNLKVVLYIVATAILAIAILFSGGKKKLLSKNDSVAQAAITTSSQQDPTQNATQLKSQVKDERVRQRQDELAAADALGIAQTGQNTTPLYDSKGQLIPPSAQRAAYGSGGEAMQQQKTAAEQQQEELNKKEQELEFYQEVPKQPRLPGGTGKAACHYVRREPAAGRSRVRPANFLRTPAAAITSRSRGHWGRPAAHVTATATSGTCGH